VPVVIVQHIASGFVQGLAQWLDQTCGVPIHIATDGETALPAHVYIAPEDRHMGIDGNGRIRLNDGPPDHGLRPSVSHLFRSVAGAFGPRAAGVLLTGMGRDGAQELKLMRDGGAVTVAQDEATSIVHGMPGAAIKLDGAAYVLSPVKIAGLLNHLMSRNV
jgi:two-component system chemotaxis response regulator CheB